MKYITLIFANLRRKKVRTGLTIASFMVALLLFGLLVAIHNAFYGGLNATGADRLVVLNRTGITGILPLSYRDKIQQIEGVKIVSFSQWFGGIYQSERNFFAQLAVDPETFLALYPEAQMPEAQKKAFFADRQGAMVGNTLAERFGWKLGDRIPLKGTIFRGNWEFNIRAIYQSNNADFDTSSFYFHYKLLEELGPKWFRGFVGNYLIRISDPKQATQVAKAIDRRFANSPFESKTDTEKAFAASMINQAGNVELLILAVGGIVFFTLLLVTGNTMAIAVRERVGELAVLKTVGFSDLHVLLLILAESALVALVGGGTGVAAAMAIAPSLSEALPGMRCYIGLGGLSTGVATAALVGLAAGAVPAVSAMRLRVVDALRRV